MSRTQNFEWHKHFVKGHEEVEDDPNTGRLFVFCQVFFVTPHTQKLQNHQSLKLEIWRYDKSLYEVVHLHFFLELGHVV